MSSPLPTICADSEMTDGSFETELRQLTSLFLDRVVNHSLEFATEYLDHGENELALETLCDYLCEEDVALNEFEYQELLRLGSQVGADLNAGRFGYLKVLVTIH